MPLHLYSLFHLNLAYSSIEEQDRLAVITRCYWPLLKLAKELKVPIGIEATGNTLEEIEALDPGWIEELRRLLGEGLCEFVGSGYAQIIAPLVPAEVNAANLSFGNEVYERLLGNVPTIALVNEQAYSAGLIEHYLKAGYHAIIMEWENPFHAHPEWNPDWRYFPQFACDSFEQTLPVIWNQSIAFQKFQRFAHGEMEWADYVAYLATHVGSRPRVFALYGNDAEVFAFRPGRYHTEPLSVVDEWARIHELYNKLGNDDRFQFIRPSETLKFLSDSSAGQRVRLESSESPIQVKKQTKYNVLRWAVTGRDDGGINAACFRAYEALKMNPFVAEDDWRELCYLWSSDFRTHITTRRWKAFQRRLSRFQKVLGLSSSQETLQENLSMGAPSLAQLQPQWDIRRCGHFLEIENNHVAIRLNCRRGLAIDGYWLRALSSHPLIGTLPHGFFDDIAMGADFYSGHLILESPGRPKLTDLTQVEPKIVPMSGESGVHIQCQISTPLGPIEKTLSVEWNGELRIRYALHWTKMPPGALRIWPITLMPNSFDGNSLMIRTHNGGFSPEKFSLQGGVIDHSRSVSFLVSANAGLGMTEGTLLFGDDRTNLSMTVKQSMGYLVPLVTAFSVGRSYFSRVAFSASECDDTTRKHSVRGRFPKVYELRLAAQSEPVVAEPVHEQLMAAGAVS